MSKEKTSHKTTIKHKFNQGDEVFFLSTFDDGSTTRITEDVIKDCTVHSGTGGWTDIHYLNKEGYSYPESRVFHSIQDAVDGLRKILYAEVDKKIKDDLDLLVVNYDIDLEPAQKAPAAVSPEGLRISGVPIGRVFCITDPENDARAIPWRGLYLRVECKHPTSSKSELWVRDIFLGIDETNNDIRVRAEIEHPTFFTKGGDNSTDYLVTLLKP